VAVPHPVWRCPDWSAACGGTTILSDKARLTGPRVVGVRVLCVCVHLGHETQGNPPLEEGRWQCCFLAAFKGNSHASDDEAQTRTACSRCAKSLLFQLVVCTDVAFFNFLFVIPCEPSQTLSDFGRTQPLGALSPSESASSGPKKNSPPFLQRAVYRPLHKLFLATTYPCLSQTKPSFPCLYIFITEH
jgi:hypothetical protein